MPCEDIAEMIGWRCGAVQIDARSRSAILQQDGRITHSITEPEGQSTDYRRSHVFEVEAQKEVVEEITPGEKRVMGWEGLKSSCNACVTGTLEEPDIPG